MTKKAFHVYFNFILIASLISNFIKVFFPATDYIFGIVLGIVCLAVNVFLFYFRYEEGKRRQIILITFFAMSIVLLALEIVSIDYPHLMEYSTSPYDYYEPRAFSIPNAALVYMYYFSIISRVIYIINSATLIVFFSLKYKKANA